MATAMVQPAVLFLLLLSLPVSGAAADGRKLVFILAGQSNMSGRGGATNGTWDGIVPPGCVASPRILRLSPDLHWEEACEPLHAGIDVGNVLGIGPGMPFAHAVLARQGAAVWVGLVPCAQGATPIANWSRGTELYERMVTRARAALAGCNGGCELTVMLWFQGETDAVMREDAELYQGRMEALVRNVRRDMNSPDLLVIEVGIATAQYNGNFLNRVREPQKAVTRFPNAMFNSSMPWGCPLLAITRILPPKLRSSSATC